MTAPLAAAEAACRILEDVRRQPALRVPLDDALDSVLAEDMVSPLDIPAWTNSAMDGYAARGADVRGASAEQPVRLRVIEQLPAGSFPTRPLGPGEVARIFTGAPLPDGADTVVRQEDTDEGAETVTIVRDRDVGVNFRRVGEDIRRGATVLTAGVALGPAELGVLASLAVAQPLVYRRPRVAILGSGDEIVDVDRPEEILSGRKIASSNTHTLAALVRRAGGEPVNLGIARDTPESLREHLGRALDCDLLVTTAGISVGEHDYVRSVLTELGAEQRFWKLRMRPGAPVGFGLLGGIPWIGLPGNPVSTMVTFELFVRPAIRKMSGHPLPFRRSVPVRMAEPVSLKPKLQHFLRGIVREGPDGPEARLTGPQGSGILTSMVLANALLIIPEGQFDTPAGSLVPALRLDDPVHQVSPVLARGATCRARDFGAQGDGMHDDTAALQTALDRAAELGEGVVVLSPGVYRVSDPLVFRGDGCALLGVGQPTIAAGGLLTRILDSDGRSRLRIAGVSVQGAGVHERGGRGAVHLDEGSAGCTVENVEVVDAPGTGMVDDGDGNTVRGCAIERTGEHGLYVSGSRGGTYEGNRITGAGSVPGATLLAHGISVADAAGCTVRSNAVTGGSGPGIVLRDGSRGILVTRNLVRDTGDRPLLIGTGSESLIAENVIEGAPAGRDALQVAGGGGNRIERNYVHQVGPGGAAIRWVSDEALGGDVVAGNVILLDGSAVNFWALALEAPRAAPIRIERNTIQAIRGAAPPAAIRVGTGRGHLLLDNLVLGVPELSDRGAATVAHFRAARQIRRLGPGVHQVLAEDGVLRCDARSGAVTVVLPDAWACRWRVYPVVVANGAHPVIVRGSGGARVAGMEAFALGAGGALLQSTGGGWQQIA